MTSEQLHEIRAILGLSKRAFADALGISPNTMTGYLNGGKIPLSVQYGCTCLLLGLPPAGEMKWTK